ncbi:hypothetical protein [Methylobacterium sp. CM6257]
MSIDNLPACSVDSDGATGNSRAAYYILEAYTEFGDHYLLATLEDAENEGGYALHIGLPDRPDDRRAEIFMTFEEGVARLAELRERQPHADLYLSTQQIIAKIEADDVWEGVVFVQAEIDDTDYDNEWNQLASVITRADTDGVSLRRPLKDWLIGHGDDLSDVIWSVIDHL